MRTAPLHLPKKVTEKPSVNHIGSSTSHQLGLNDVFEHHDVILYVHYDVASCCVHDATLILFILYWLQSYLANSSNLTAQLQKLLRRSRFSIIRLFLPNSGRILPALMEKIRL